MRTAGCGRGRGGTGEAGHRGPTGRATLVTLLAGTALVACGPGGEAPPAEEAAPAGEAADAGQDGDHLAAARAFFEEGRYDSALRRFTLAAEGPGETAVALNERGMTYAARGQTERAVADLDSALSLRPGYASALSNLAVVHIQLGRYEQAVAELDSLTKLRPEDARAYHHRARAYEGLGRIDRALEDLDRAVALDSGLAEAYVTRGALYAGRDDLDLAVADFETAVALSGAEGARKNLGIARLESGDHEGALEVFDRLVSEHPLRARYLLYRGRAYRGLGREGEAEADFRRALELTGNPGIREQAIRALREMGVTG